MKIRIHEIARFRALICILLAIQFSVSGLAVTSDIPQYNSHLWQTDDGLPHNFVQTIIQLRDGYLCIGTQKGLVRFDGLRFTTPEAATKLAEFSITALYEDRNGALWIGSERNGLFELLAGKLTRYNREKGLPDNYVRTIFQSHDGTIWTGTSGGLTKIQDGKSKTLTTSDGLAGNVVRGICENAEGIWIASQGGVNLIKNEKVLATYSFSSGLPDNSARAVWAEDDDTVWIGTNNGLSRRNKNGRFTYFNQKNGMADTLVTTIFEDRKRNLWIGTSSGLHFKSRDRAIVEINDGQTAGFINDICEDREGNIWVGTKEGLIRLKPRPITTFSKQDGLTHDNAMSVLEDRSGIMWVTTWGGGMNQIKDGKVIWTYGRTNKVTDLFLALCEGRDGFVWLGSDYNGGLFRFGNGTILYHGKAEGIEDAAIRVLFEDSKKNLWIGTSRSLIRFRNGKDLAAGKAEEYFTPGDGLAGATVRSICEDDDENLWIGTNDGLSRCKDGKFANFSKRDGLSSAAITALYFDVEKNLWIGTTGGGLNRFRNGKFTAYSSFQGLFSDEIAEILEDGNSNLWMGSWNGIFRVNKKQFDDLDSGKARRLTCLTFGKSDGMLSVNCNSSSKPAGWKSKDGRLWFATTRGLAIVTPGSDFDPNPIPPPVAIEEVIADRKVQSLKFKVQSPNADALSTSNFELETLNLPPGAGELEFRYTALSLRSPEKNRFKYKLEGVDQDWMDADVHRIAHYNNVPPGNYRFHIIACNSDGLWNERGSSVAIILQPHFWQKAWFIGFCLFGGVAVVGVAARYVSFRKIRHRLEIMERESALEKERTRIANDMHDELGAHLTQVTLLTDLAKRDLENPGKISEHVNQISDTAREVILSLNEIVWAVNPRNDNLRGLVDYIFHFTEKLLALTEIQYQIDLPDELPQKHIGADVRHSVLLVIKESLNNIVKHARATKVHLRVALDGNQLRIVIADNGCGLPKEMQKFGNGILSMRKRMESIGGKFEIRNGQERGTIVDLVLPI